MASHARVIRFDRRGAGASDSIPLDALPPWESFAEEIECVAGGGGGGSGEQSGSQGEGGGFGLFARPSGSWVVTGEGAKWVPAIDLSTVMVAGSFLLMIFLRYRAKSRT